MATPVHPLDALDAILAAHPSATARPGQRAMCAAAAEAVIQRRHLLAEAGTGVGKSFAYLSVAAVHHGRVVIATATKALQEQLVTKDLPLVARALEPLLGRRVRFAMLKGRSNYLCVAKTHAAVAAANGDADALFDDTSADHELIEQLAWWAWETGSGDQADVPFEVRAAQWRLVSTDARECPGAKDCAFSEPCFAEAARRKAMAADIIVVNSHLYALHTMLEAEGSGLLPEHDLVILDEAHTLEDIAVGAFSLELAGARLRWLAGRVRAIVQGSTSVDGLAHAAELLDKALAPQRGLRVTPDDGDIGSALAATGKAAASVAAELAGIHPATEDAALRHRMAVRATDALLADVSAARQAGPGDVAWVREHGALAVSPVEASERLSAHLFSRRTTILTSATLAIGGDFALRAQRLGLEPPQPLAVDADSAAGDYPPGAEGFGPQESTDGHDAAAEPHTLDCDALSVESPFDYRANTLLYCATDLPDPNSDTFRDAAVERLATLMHAAGGRTLALFTSHAALRHAAERLPDLVPFPLLVQDEAPRGLLMERFVQDEQACLLATMGFWQGVDVPGRGLSLVVVDRLPFPHRNDPLTQARRELATKRRRPAFTDVDLPHAATLLAQGAGRLIRTQHDRGLVAVLDRRLALKDSYRATLLRSLPPMPRSTDLTEAEAFLRACVSDGAAGVPG